MGAPWTGKPIAKEPPPRPSRGATTAARLAQEVSEHDDEQARLKQEFMERVERGEWPPKRPERPPRKSLRRG